MTNPKLRIAIDYERTCWKVWRAHRAECVGCGAGSGGPRCRTGLLAWDEWVIAARRRRSLEKPEPPTAPREGLNA